MSFFTIEEDIHSSAQNIHKNLVKSKVSSDKKKLQLSSFVRNFYVKQKLMHQRGTTDQHASNWKRS